MSEGGNMTVSKISEKKIDRAFEVVERLEKKEKNENPGVQACETPKASKPAKHSGLRFRFSMDALISEQDSKSAPAGDIRPGQSKLVDFNVTIPHVWKIPVLGKTALKIVRYFQTEDRSESIRDILSSLKRKKR